jgi:glycosyltransferase involved in cell wall biosynthesis
VRLGILVSRLPPEALGGAERQAAKLAEHLGRDHDVRLFVRSRDVPPELAASPRCRVIRRTRVDLRGVRFPADVIGSLLAIRRERYALDALIAYQTVIDGLIGVLAKRAFGIPVLVSVRSEQEYQLATNRQSRLLAPFVFRHADRIAVQSERLRAAMLAELSERGETLAREVEAKLGVLPNGVDVPLAPSSPGAGGYVLYAGRLVEDKGVIHLVEAMRQCPSERLVIAGDGPERGRLERAAVGLANVSFIGRVPVERMASVLAGAKMLVLPSLRNEGVPNVVLEAMACGVPVVASRDAGIPDFVEEGRTGLLTEPGDARGIAGAVQRLATEPALAAACAERARDRIGHYAWPRIAALFEAECAALVRRD